MSQLTHPLDENTKSLIRGVLAESLPDLIMDVVWNDFFYYMTFFESFDGWGGDALVAADIDSDGSTDLVFTQFQTDIPSSGDKGLVMLGGAGIHVNAGNVVNSITGGLRQAPLTQPILSFNRRSRFRTQIKLLNTTDMDAYIKVGHTNAAPLTVKHYGFHIDETVLKGTCGDGTTGQTVTLGTVAADDDIILEARFLPTDKVTFYISTTGIENLKEVGTLTTNLPSGELVDTVFDDWALLTAVATTGVTDQGAWTNTTGYSALDLVQAVRGLYRGMTFIAIDNHTSAAGDEPSFGADWTDHWDLYGFNVSFFEYIQRKPQRAPRKLS